MSIHLVNGIYLADTARVMGEVTLGEGVNIWYGVTIRGDVAPVTVGPGTNVQENAVIHCNTNRPNVVGRDVTIGHSALVHGSEVGDGSLIGMGAILLANSRVGQRCLIAAGAVVPPEFEVPDDSVVMGVPGRVVRKTRAEERKSMIRAAEQYQELARLHHEHPEDPRVKAWDACASS